MSRWKDALLRPFLAAAARPGLGNPHNPYEIELMVAGAKPVAILGAYEIDTRLQRMIDNGFVVIVGEKDHAAPGTVYCLPEELDLAKDIVASLNTTQAYEYLTRPPYHFYMSDENGLPTVENLENGSCRIVDCMDNYPDHFLKPFREAAAEKRIIGLDFHLIDKSYVLAQADRIEDGKELYARYFNSNEGYPELSGKDWSKRIGSLLGFTENDLAWHTNEKYQNPFVLKFMEATADIRRQARIKLMLMDAPRSGPG